MKLKPSNTLIIPGPHQGGRSFSLRINILTGDGYLSGKHEGYPSYEMRVNNVMVYDFGEGFIGELFGSGDVEFSGLRVLKNFKPLPARFTRTD